MMDTDVLVQKALECMEREDFARAKVYLKRAASQAPLRNDIRELLQYTLEEAPARSSTVAHKPSFGQPRARRSVGLMIITAAGLVLIGGALGVFLHLSGLAQVAADAGDRKKKGGAALEDKAEQLAEQGLYERAIDTMEQAIAENPAEQGRLNPRIAFWHETIAGDLEESNLPEAIKHLQKALRADAYEVRRHTHLGRLLLQRARTAEQGGSRRRTLDQAAETLRDALRLDPNHLQALYNLGLTEAASNRRSEAVAQFRKIIDIAPDSPEAQLAEKQLTSMQVKEP